MACRFRKAMATSPARPSELISSGATGSGWLRTLRASPSTASSAHYRPDIDGLRAIAILLVVIFHAFPGAVPGGFVGVDVFFVISGFLITGIILDAHRRGQFTFREFYFRRARRIFPALIIVLLATYAVAWRLLLPDEFVSVGRNLLGGVLFSSNLVLLNEAGYFDFDANLKPLLHLWSLGVEEQFYIFWPLTMWLAARARHRSTIALIAWSVLLASYALNVAVSPSAPAPAFYLPITRIWEILSGAMLALRPTAHDSFVILRVRRFFVARFIDAARRAFGVEPRAVLGFCLIVWAALAFNRHVNFPGWRASLPVLGAVLLISAEGSWISAQLGRRVPVYIGLISYPLYLWHWPALAFLHLMQFQVGKPPAWELVGAIALSVALASVTYHVVEKPIRSERPNIARVAALSAIMASLGVLGMVTIAENGFVSRLPPAVRGAVSITVDLKTEWREHRCFLEPGDNPSQFDDSCIDEGSGPLVFLWGDSAAAALYPGLRQFGQSAGFRVAEFAQSACPPVLDIDMPDRPFCRSGNQAVLAAIAHDDPQVVVLPAMWGDYNAVSVAQVERSIAELQRLGSPRIVLIGPPPLWDRGLPRAMLEYYMQWRTMMPQYSRFRLLNNDHIENSLRAIAMKSNIKYFSIYDAMCNPEGCLTRLDDDAKDITTFDVDHLTPAASAFVVRKLLPSLLPAAADVKRP
jgi:peptidoglycan/LPS O-acetylase OafA/YrhL